jgi:hypothetical protein
MDAVRSAWESFEVELELETTERRLAEAERFIADRQDNERRIAGALRSAIEAHGPITPEWIGSAAKRVESTLRRAHFDRKRDTAAP